jgi:hypothetical protein
VQISASAQGPQRETKAGHGESFDTFAGGKTTCTEEEQYVDRGQLSVYLRLLDVPVPSIYGPSADENPFIRQQPISA